MKKVFALLAATALLLCCFTGCLGGTREFTCQGLKMSVPADMRDVTEGSEFEKFTFALDSDKVAIFGLKESFSDFPKSTTLEEYAELVIKAKNLEAFASKNTAEGYCYFRYDSAKDGVMYRYLTAMYLGSDAFWTVQIVSDALDYEEDTFFRYLDTVEFS